MLNYLCLCLVFSEFVSNTELSADYIGDIDNFHISYGLRNDNVESELQQLLKDAPDRVVSIKTAEREEYKCILPVVERVTHQQQILDYKGPTPAELIKPLIAQKTISIFGGNGYWLYHFAHGNYILQYHEDREKKEKIEYFLGNYRADQSEEDTKKFDHMNPPKMRIKDVDYPYYPVQYRYGTACDLTNKPRETTVMYICHEQVEHIVYSVTEVSTCNYELVLLTNLLCSHPAFQTPTIPEREIYCYASPNAVHARPAKLLELEKQIRTEKTEQHSSSDSSKLSAPDKDSNPGQKASVIDRLLEEFPTYAKWLSPDAAAKYHESLLTLKRAETSPFWQMIRRMDKELSDEDYDNLNEFWEGKTCYIGGSGYWKYEFCYGSKVTQFHSDGTKRTHQIVLGEWDEEAHIHWFQKHKDNAIVVEDSDILQVSHYYGNGDFCDEIKKRRSVEVRIKCRESPESEHPTTVFLIIEEPTTCHYTLTLQAGMFCSGLQDIDMKNGLSTHDPEIEKLMKVLDGRTNLLKAVKDMWNEMDEEEEGDYQE